MLIAFEVHVERGGKRLRGQSARRAQLVSAVFAGYGSDLSRIGRGSSFILRDVEGQLGHRARSGVPLDSG